MAITYPTSLDSLTNPESTNKLNAPGHAQQHADANDALEALEAKVGANSSAVTTSHDYKLGEVLTTDKAVGKTATQTLTNKTLTAPVIATSLDMNGTELILDADADTSLTADTDDQIDVKIAGADDFLFAANVFRALSGSALESNTINETTAASGVTIDGLLIKDSKLATNDSVVEANITDGVVGVAKIKSEQWTDYDPNWTALVVDPAIGNGTIQGRYIKRGREVTFTCKIIMGSTTTYGTGEYYISMPFASTNHPGVYAQFGTLWGYDADTTTRYAGIALLENNTSVVTLQYHGQTVSAQSTAPITWAQNDQIGFTITYEAAA